MMIRTLEKCLLSNSRSGAQTKTAANVREALELWDHWEPNVLVSDIGMPVEDGYDLIRRVRARAEVQIPAVALTGYASSEDAARVLAAGYQLHLAKPLHPRDSLSKQSCPLAEPASPRRRAFLMPAKRTRLEM